jgi:hypothetical protein
VTEKLYQRRMVAFIDILGWSEASKQETLQIANAVQIIHETARNYSAATKERIASSFGYELRYDAIHVGAMSDSLAISLPHDEGYEIFKMAAYTCARLLELGFLTRGGVTIGGLYHRENIIFGPALVEAVQLEKEAIFPRLICSHALLKHLECFKESAAEADPQRHRIIIDHLGRSVVNLFALPTLTKTGYTPKQFATEVWHIGKIEQLIQSQIDRYSGEEGRNEKNAEKWDYMQRVMQTMLDSLSL